MARKDELTGRKTASGRKVSHSHRKSPRKFGINLIRKRVWDEEKGSWVTLRVTAKTLRTIRKNGLAAVRKKNS
ncbi:50S ribosomal protein L28 [bacterium]|nr:50S ribosomal protein L28 [bacterium]